MAMAQKPLFPLEEHPEDFPWRVGDGQRADLLEWFLAARLDEREPILWVAALTGRFHRAEPYQGRARRPWRAVVRDVIQIAERAPWPSEPQPSALEPNTKLPQSLEHGDLEIEAKHVPVPYDQTYGDWHPDNPEWPPRVTFAQMSGYYDQIQRSLQSVRQEWATSGGRLPLPLMSAASLEYYLEDARVGFGRDRHDMLERRIDVRTSSLVGELAYALLLELTGARSAGFCLVCKRPWTSPTQRKRKTCGREECRSALRNEWKQAHPEPRASVRERVRRHRERVTRMRRRRSS